MAELTDDALTTAKKGNQATGADAELPDAKGDTAIGGSVTINDRVANCSPIGAPRGGRTPSRTKELDQRPTSRRVHRLNALTR